MRGLKCRLGLVVLVCAMLVSCPVDACTVPVYRYALERWPADPHVVMLSSSATVRANTLDLNEHHANLWVQRAPTEQTVDVRIVYADSERTWYEGSWDPTLLTRLADSPLRRRIAHELATGKVAFWILLESASAATNDTVYAMLRERLNALRTEIGVPEQPDYEDEVDGYAGPGGSLSAIPVRVDFALHRLSRRDRDEAFLVQQITGLDPAFLSDKETVLVAIFGRGRMIPLYGEELVPDAIDELAWFLCSACSCRVKTLNPGIDLLMAAAWDEAVYEYPFPAKTRLPDGTSFYFGGTGNVVLAVAGEGEAGGAKSDLGGTQVPLPSHKRRLFTLAAVAALLLLSIAWRLRRRDG